MKNPDTKPEQKEKKTVSKEELQEAELEDEAEAWAQLLIGA